MCLQTSNIIALTAPNWEGDNIVHSPVIRAARYIPDTTTRYPIDIREYLTTAANAVVRQALEDAAELLPSDEARVRFWSRRRGAFDHRVRTICSFVASRLTYRKKRDRGLDQWMFPDETLENRGGDCEDHAFLLAALILASGVSGYVVRVALGKVRDVATGKATDHAWVMYKSEHGNWLLLDPLLYARPEAAPPSATGGERPSARPTPSTPPTYEYAPYFLFNDAHLWAVREAGMRDGFEQYLNERQFWDEFDPAFATSIHNDIFDAALKDMPISDRNYVKAVSLGIDANIAAYDPRDHFDNAYFEESWALVAKRFATKELGDFALMCHAIGDFYAHSSWGVFGERKEGKLQPLMKPTEPIYSLAPDYGEDGRFPLTDAARFSVNDSVWSRTRSEGAGLWAGKLVSGRYAQNKDPRQGLFEKLTYIPRELRDAEGYATRSCLPHHNEVAVDGKKPHDGHTLYDTEAGYAQAFAERVEAATAHIRALYEIWR